MKWQAPRTRDRLGDDVGEQQEHVAALFALGQVSCCIATTSLYLGVGSFKPRSFLPAWTVVGGRDDVMLGQVCIVLGFEVVRGHSSSSTTLLQSRTEHGMGQQCEGRPRTPNLVMHS